MGGPVRSQKQGRSIYLLWTGSRGVAAHASMMKDSYDPGFGAPVATLFYVGFSKRAKIDDNQASQSMERTAFCSIEYGVGNTNSSLGGKGTGKRMTLGSP